MIEQFKSLKAHIPLRKIRGMMVYYYAHKKGTRNFVNMELENGTVVKLQMRDPKKNIEFV